jgi:hypothetical protein
MDVLHGGYDALANIWVWAIAHAVALKLTLCNASTNFWIGASARGFTRRLARRERRASANHWEAILRKRCASAIWLLLCHGADV